MDVIIEGYYKRPEVNTPGYPKKTTPQGPVAFDPVYRRDDSLTGDVVLLDYIPGRDYSKPVPIPKWLKK